MCLPCVSSEQGIGLVTLQESHSYHEVSSFLSWNGYVGGRVGWKVLWPGGIFWADILKNASRAGGEEPSLTLFVSWKEQKHSNAVCGTIQTVKNLSHSEGFVRFYIEHNFPSVVTLSCTSPVCGHSGDCWF